MTFLNYEVIEKQYKSKTCGSYNDTQLNSKVYSKDEVKDTLIYSSQCVVTYLLVLFYFAKRYPKNIDSWKFIVFDNINCMPKLKETNEYPTKTFIDDIVFDEFDNYFFKEKEFILHNADYEASRRVKNSFSKYVVMPADDSNDYEFCKIYLEWISKAVSETGVVTKDAVYKQIDGLLKKFSRL